MGIHGQDLVDERTTYMKSFIVILVFLASAGLLFSGYLSAVNLLSDTCASDEPCPLFLGYPACFYGFAMYLVMFFVTGLGVLGRVGYKKVFLTDVVVSIFGIVFAGRFVVQELLQAHITGTLGLSTCAYGLIFYVSIFIVSLIGKSRPTQ
jgi:hypothetical protein